MGIIDDLTPEFRQRCEAISTDLRHQLNLRAFDRLLANQLASHLNATILHFASFPNLDPQVQVILQSSESWSAATICLEPIQIIYNPTHGNTRRESDLMHELAHLLLEHPMAHFDTNKSPVRKKRYEQEATYLGGCLQIPRRGLLWAKQRGMAVSQVAGYFGASEAMVQFRNNISGVK
ncbi:MAG: ImmA/IrrE family metallo-endopeptidase [Merismopedia sp. SIO2A8]|nr:ImmA/IrrE family metallo-endopeptidase [Symploca sp. SIO2B6]NET48036.1 ImmA/IrrE family metallo-endopeptidase [Merismopedia sp. SIO2A8]